jgi:Putative DNA-binding domain
MPFNETIEAFARALADPARPPPSETMGRERQADARRFAIYRNNIAVSLIAAIEARYPVTRRLVGDAFFRAMTRAFVAGAKPRSAIILDYGADFPDFIAGFEPARDLAYLADVACVENAWVEAYHSAEAKPLTVAALTSIDPTTFSDLKFAFHPAARLLRSNHPAASIWAGHQGDGEVKAPDDWRGEDILVTRPDADVRVRILPAGGYSFAQALQSGEALGKAHTTIDFEGFDPGSHLIGLIEAGAIARIKI